MLLVIDGNNLAHRCKHVFSLSNNGKDVSVTFGFLRTMYSYIRKYDPASVLVCWDGGIPRFRVAAVPEYKANRHKDDDPTEYEDFLRQMQELSDYALPMMGVCTVRRVGVEADDLMAAAVRMQQLGDCMIVSSDKDMLQCCREDKKLSRNVTVLRPSTNGKDDKIYNIDKVEEEFDIEFEKYVEWRALQGDKSDNIPGVAGIGGKTASKLFKQFGTLTGITNAAAGINPAGTIDGRLGEAIMQFGFDRIARNIFITSLHADRVGAKAALLGAMSVWRKADKDRMKKYFLANAFVSLLDGDVVGSMMKLNPPLFSTDTTIPKVCHRRKPVA